MDEEEWQERVKKRFEDTVMLLSVKMEERVIECRIPEGLWLLQRAETDWSLKDHSPVETVTLAKWEQVCTFDLQDFKITLGAVCHVCGYLAARGHLKQLPFIRKSKTFKREVRAMNSLPYKSLSCSNWTQNCNPNSPHIQMK